MEARNKLTWSLIAVLFFVAVVFFVARNPEDTGPVVDGQSAMATYGTSEYSPQFTYPRTWGEVTQNSGNSSCPEEDTYRTQDTLSVYDMDFSFPERKLPNSESFIRMGMRTRELNPARLNDCGDNFLHQIGSKKIDPRTISSVRLQPVTLPSGLWGTFNDRASRLNTEGREQYVLFMTDSLERIYIIQPYLSFIPHFGSPELDELDNKYDGDMDKYLKEGQTALPIREIQKQFRQMVQTLSWRGE